MRALLLLLLVACGPKTKDNPADGPEVPEDSQQPDSPPLQPCDYSELRDTTNDDVFAKGTPEDTGLTFDQKLVVCGSYAADHFDDQTVDVDAYKLTLAADADVLVRLHGAGAETMDLVGLDIYTGATFDDFVGGNTFYGDHAVVHLHLVAGSYELSAFALSEQPLAAAVSYRITIDVDTPATRCPSVVSGASYAEANDGANNTGNDMLSIPSGMPIAQTASVTDSPEPTGLVVGGSSQDRIGGLLVDVAVSDQYEDKDTFLITTEDANELAIKLDWNNGASNLDYLLFEANTTDAVVRAQTVSNTGPEYRTFSVKPSTAYWVLVGAKTGSTFPVAYSASLCGGSFTP